ncbi:MAG: hypothetical protein QXD03_03165 [Candidatus Anstonellales archaeon]
MDLNRVYEELKKDGVTTETIYQYSHPIKTKGRLVNMSLGRIWFNLLLPDDYPIIDEQINKKKLNKILTDIVKKYPSDEVAKVYSNIQRESFKLSSMIPVSVSAESLVLPDNLKEEKDKLKNIKDPLEFQKKAYEIAEKYYNYLKENNSKLFSIIDSGAKSSIKDLANIMIARGPVIGLDDKISEPISSSINDGFSVEEYYMAAKESRKTLYIRSKGAAEPGYLARKVVFANSNTILKGDDCKTKRTLRITILDSMVDRIKGRYFISKDGRLTLIDDSNCRSLINKTIDLRSPLYCIEKDNGICKTCYGRMSNFSNNNIGILAGNIINAVGVEGYAMKSRHKASQIDFKEANILEDMIDIGHNDELKRYLNISKNSIKTAYKCSVSIYKKDYRDEDDIVETSEYISVPGIITFNFIDFSKELTLFLPYNVKLLKNISYDDDGKYITIEYNPGDLILYQDLVDTTTNMSMIIRLLEGRVKYIKDPVILLYTMHNQIPSIDIIHFEVILSNMFRCSEDLSKRCRYKGSYSNSVIVGQAEQPFIDSWYSTMAFERIDKAIINALVYGVNAEKNPLEKVMVNEYD